MPVNKVDPKIIFASNAPAIDKPPVFSDKTQGWDVSRVNNGRPKITQMNKIQQDTDLKILWLNENAVAPYDSTIDYPVGTVVVKDGSFQKKTLNSWELFSKPKNYILEYFKEGVEYPINAILMLNNGELVQSTEDSNTKNPNVDMTGWVLKGSLKSVPSINDLLLIQNPSDNQIANVLSYYDGQGIGGGLFTFNSSLASNNNGVTIFNGWVRDLSSRKLSTDDAGIIADGSNATEKLRNLASIISGMNNFTFEVIGDHLVNSNIYFK